MGKPDDKRISCTRHVGGKNHQFFDGKKDVYSVGEDSYYIAKFSKDKTMFSKIVNELEFDQMFSFSDGDVSPIPRMVIAQCEKGQRSPIYRMPGCNEKNIRTTNWTKNVKAVVDDASVFMKQELNHCVATLFRDNDDSLAFHKDKMLDLKDNTYILSLSFGAARPIVFTSDDGKKTQTIMLKSGSLLAIGPKTNKRWYHAIPKVEEEVEPRISLSVRTITTFIDREGEITGQGAEFQDKNYPFTKNYENEEISEDLKKKIEDFQKQSRERLMEIKKNYVE